VFGSLYEILQIKS